MLFAVAALFTSCSNDDIEVRTQQTLTVSLSNFFSSYNYNDTRHDIKIADDFRTFYSEDPSYYIQVRTLFYNSDGILVDSVKSYVQNTNDVTTSINLTPGTYTAVTTLVFALDNSGTYDDSYWYLVDKENLSQAKLQLRTRFSPWAIMSYAAKTVTVDDNTQNITMNPAPVGSVGYFFGQNFQYLNEQNIGTIADNGVRSISIYSQRVATAFKLDPNATEKYEYMDDAGRDSWYHLSSFMEPTDFNSSWTFFQSNLYSYFYILAPEFNLTFGYMSQGDSGFTSYGENTYTIKSGTVYLAYWDWFQVGNPYFGEADNDHWNTYSTNSKANNLFDFSAPAKKNLNW